MTKRVRRFAGIYSLVLLLLSVLTVTRVNPLALPTLRMTALNILPMLGFMVLCIGALVGGLVIYIMGDQHLGKVYAVGGTIFALVAAVVVSNAFRAPIVRSVSSRIGHEAAQKMAEKEGRYVVPHFQEKEHMPYFRWFLDREDGDLVRSGFCRGYNECFLSEHAGLIQEEELSKRGLEAGRNAGMLAGRRAAVRGRAAGKGTVDEQTLQELRRRHLPTYVEAFKEGYAAGWQEAAAKKR